MIGKMYNEFWGQVSALTVFVGFNLTFLPQFVMGTQGMPRRYAMYEPEFTFLHQDVDDGCIPARFGLLIAAGVLLSSIFTGKKAPANPWGGSTLEWQCASPPPHYNFEHAPIVNEPYDFTPLVYISPEKGWGVPARREASGSGAFPLVLIPSKRKHNVCDSRSNNARTGHHDDHGHGHMPFQAHHFDDRSSSLTRAS